MKDANDHQDFSLELLKLLSKYTQKSSVSNLVVDLNTLLRSHLPTTAPQWQKHLPAVSSFISISHHQQPLGYLVATPQWVSAYPILWGILEKVAPLLSRVLADNWLTQPAEPSAKESGTTQVVTPAGKPDIAAGQQQSMAANASGQPVTIDYQHLIKQAPVGILTVNNKGQVITANIATHKLLGYSSDAEAFHNLFELIHKKDRESTQINWDLLVNDALHALIREVRVKKSDGHYTWIQLHASQIESTGDMNDLLLVIMRDISVRKQFEHALMESKKETEELLARNQSLVAALPDIMFLFDANLRIIDFHTPDDQLLYQSPKHFLNKPIDQVLPPHLVSLTKEKSAIAHRERSVQQYQYTLEIKQKTHYFEARMVPMKNKQSLSIVRDVSEREKFEQALIEAKEKAEESDRLKTAFLQNLSHEIRTPMNGIIGFTDLLSKQNNDKHKRHKYIQIIQANSHKLLNIINAILDISKIETGQIEVHFEECPLNQLLSEVLNLHEPSALKKNVSLYLNKGWPDGRDTIATDRQKLYQICNNLISNAIKFTDTGFVELGYRMQGEALEFFVKDSGEGIPKQFRHKVFQRFQQADSSLSRTHGGTGLGLAISKGLVEAMGGHIRFETEIGKGTTFFFTLPTQNK